MSGRHIGPAGAAVIMDALVSAITDGASAGPHSMPTSVEALLRVHGNDLIALLIQLSAEDAAETPVPCAYDVLQMAHRLAAAGELDDAARLRRLADSMIATSSAVRWVGVDPAKGPDVTAALIAVGLDDGTKVFASIDEVVRECVPVRREDQLRIVAKMTRYSAELLQRARMAGKGVGHG